MGSDDLIDFEVIENQKENIQSLPSGRSAKALAQLYTPPLSSTTGKIPSPSQTQDANNATRQEFEKELQLIDESDDPLDVYVRYVNWTLDAYPSAQNTPQSQLCPLLERATKAFHSSTLYKNDPRYLKLWLHYIRLFSDSPRETFAYLARHNIGEKLASFYEEFAAWLEMAGRWTQAEEVYQLGIDHEARPMERLIRKFGEFQHRFENRPQNTVEPTSPALPTVRPALAAKIDPYSHASPAPADPQAQGRSRAAGGSSKSSKAKMAIFADGGEVEKPGSSGSMKGWDSIGTLAERKKENTTEARPWVGETLKVGKKNTGVQKMMIFKDETTSIPHDDQSVHPLREQQQSVNPRTGRVERVYVNLAKVYPNLDDPMAEEYSFEELRAKQRGYMDIDWATLRRQEQEKAAKTAELTPLVKVEQPKATLLAARDVLPNIDKPQTVPLKGLEEDFVLNDENNENAPPSREDIEKAKMARKARREERANRTRKIKVMEVREIRGETQTIQTNLASPTGPKIRRKKGGTEPTMTINTKEAMDEVYEIFNQPLKNPAEKTEEVESGAESSDDDDYTSAGESTGTGRISCAASEFGDETEAADFTFKTTMYEEEEGDEADDTDVKSVSAWSDFTEIKPTEQARDEPDNDTEPTRDDPSEVLDTSRDQAEEEHDSALVTPTSPEAHSVDLPTRFVPVPPEDCDIPTRPYRDPAQVANNRLPFMTPIVEKTESSLGIATARTQKEYFSAKTPSRSKGTPAILEDASEPWSSPFQDVLQQAIDAPERLAQPPLHAGKVSKFEPATKPQAQASVKALPEAKDQVPKGPIVKDTQCNPVDEAIREVILRGIHPALSTYDGYFEDPAKASGRSTEIRKFTKAVSKVSKNSSDKTATNLSMPPILRFAGSDRTYSVKRELGKGAFAPVYLIESAADEDEDEDQPARMGKGDFGLKRRRLEALKMEDPPSAWEFYIMRQAKRRLGVSRAADSIIHAYEMHMFKDEGFLVEEYRDQGTLLDLVNIARADNGVMDEQMAMFFTVELFRTVEALHAKGLIHGDLKADNILVRFDALQHDERWDSQYQHDGRNGWATKGVALIDFGRGIDIKAFEPNVQFIADWKTSEQDCAEMREMRPWTYQVDYHGLAGVVHNLLFGKYMSTIAERGGALGAGATKTYRIRESFKRYWQTEIWQEVFNLLLNPSMHLDTEEGKRLPILKGMKSAREKMAAYLEGNCEKGVGLKALVQKMEYAVKKR